MFLRPALSQSSQQDACTQGVCVCACVCLVAVSFPQNPVLFSPDLHTLQVQVETVTIWPASLHLACPLLAS